MGKDLTEFSQGRYTMTSGHMKRYSISVVIRKWRLKAQWETTTLIKMTKIKKKSKMLNTGKVIEAPGTFVYATAERCKRHHFEDCGN